jgi:glycosyltransferase involved in cell wall biosynthesis
MSSKTNKEKFLIVTTIPASLYFFKGQVGILKSEFDIEVASGPGHGLEDFCEIESVKGHRIPKMKREISLFFDILSLINLIKLIKKIKPKVVHGNTPKGSFLSMIAAKITKTPVRIYCVHGLRYQGAKGMKRKLLMFLEKISCSLATHVFSVSFGVLKIMKEDGIYKKEGHIIWNGSVNGIDIKHFSPDAVDEIELKKQLNLSDDNLVFGFVGRMVKDKGVNELVESFIKINKLHPHTRLLLVGRFEAADAVTDFTKKEIVTHQNIIYCGQQKDIRPYLKLMDIFTFPSYREGFGVSLMEAAAMNLPAISSNITGCNEIIKDGFNGKLISSKSIKELYEMMIFFIENPIEFKKISKVSRQYVIDRYEQKKLWNKALEKYKSVVENV